jgi:hypothetical protein
MDRRSFERSLRAFQARKPYRSFTVALVNGDRVQVDHPEALVVRDGLAVFVAAGGVPTLFDHESVSQFIGEVAGSKHKSNGGPAK